ncbi:DUF433 domain-containing protein [Flexivirga alba]|uniref:DUF433 domain-containing protein n=1 Tax=Flexivirga alba TaxID=702742 RepID=A0ABW2AFP0_9MICO
MLSSHRPVRRRTAVSTKCQDVQMNSSLLDRAIYSYRDVDRLVGLHSGTARRWLEGYERAGRSYEPVLRPEPTASDSVTWGEMVEARLLAEYRSRDVPVQRLRPAIVKLREEFGQYPLARARPFLDVEGRELVRLVQDRVGLDKQSQLVVLRNDQLVLAPWTERFRSAVEYSDDVVSQLRPTARAPHVVMDPQHAFGQPAIRNVRTEVLAEDFRAGTSPDDLADLYDLSPAQVEEAIRFELIAGADRVA